MFLLPTVIHRWWSCRNNFRGRRPNWIVFVDPLRGCCWVMGSKVALLPSGSVVLRPLRFARPKKYTWRAKRANYQQHPLYITPKNTWNNQPVQVFLLPMVSPWGWELKKQLPWKTSQLYIFCRQIERVRSSLQHSKKHVKGPITSRVSSANRNP